MSFDNNYPNRKDHRKSYRKSKAFDRTCRNHGSCVWCEHTRTFDKRKKEESSKIDLKNGLSEYFEDKPNI